MATVIGVRFKKAGKVYYFDPNESVAEAGRERRWSKRRAAWNIGEVGHRARARWTTRRSFTPLKKVVRIATEEDARRAEQNAQREDRGVQNLSGYA